MSKRLRALFILVLLLTVFSIAQAQEAPSGDPIFVLTEEQINAEFNIPSTATRTVSNLEADVQEDGVHLSLDLTVTRNGTTTTHGISALLIGQAQENRRSSSFYDALISGYSVVAPPSIERDVIRLVGRAWRNYVRDAFPPAAYTHMEEIEFYFGDDGIYMYEAEGVTVQWCLECSHE
jgi:hypothetical protein